FMNALDVDEVVGQLLASEGFRTVEELAYVEVSDIASVQGLDEETATEIQTRARDYLARIEAEHEEKRLALGVQDELRQIDGVNVSRADAEAMIMSARVKAGWIEAPVETEATDEVTETEAHPA